MTYTQVLDEISPCIPLEHIAQEAGVAVESLKRTQLDKSNPSYLPPPPGWQQIIAGLARNRSGALIAIARELEEVRETALVTFQEAMNRVVPCISPEDVAQGAGVSVSEIRQDRLPPPRWQQIIAGLARDRSDVLQALARRLEGQVDSAVL